MKSAKKTIETLLAKTPIKINGQNSFDPQIHNPSFYDRILKDGSLGLGESYMEGWWDCQDLDDFFYMIFKSNLENEIRTSLKLKTEILKANVLNLQTKSKAKEAIQTHYDIGNDLYSKMLDPLMMYSCGYWKNADTLAQAQEQKIKMICEKLHLEPGETVLDIGCGWGGFAWYAAKNYGVKVVGVTISEEQQKLAQERCRDLDVEIRLQDYRDLEGKFDKIVSIGMFEHVGPKNYNGFLIMVQNLLKSEGICLLHFIGGNETVQKTDPWIDKYIFPNGVIPSLAQFGKASEEKLIVEDLQNIGLHYDSTLISWQLNFKNHWDSLKGDYNDTFFRMWNYYLSSCAASFRARRLNLWQIVLIHPEFSREYTPVRF